MNRKLAILLLACILQVSNACNGDLRQWANSQTLGPQRTAPAEEKAILPHCPSAPASALHASAQTGHRRMFLSWNASSSAGVQNNSTTGYCIYRTQRPARARDCPKYSGCEEVNVIPVRNTRCVDDLVKDDTTYYYVALAINSASNSSLASDEAIAQVPVAGEQKPRPPVSDSYPSCRTPIASKTQR